MMEATRPEGSHPTAGGPGSSFLQELKNLRQWLPWEYQDKRKVPIDPKTGKNAKWSDPGTWLSYEEAVAAGTVGVGFVLSEDDPYTVVDLDDCIVDGEVMPWASDIVEELNSYTEISPSGRGMHIWMRAKKPGPRCRKAGTGVEIYDSKHFITVTGKA